MSRGVSILLLNLIGLFNVSYAQAPSIVWVKTYYANNYDWTYGKSVGLTDDGGSIIAGYRERHKLLKNERKGDVFQVYIVRTNSKGDTLWTREYGGAGSDYASSVQQINDGGFVIAGGIQNGNSDIYLIRTDSKGDTVWTRSYGTDNIETGNSVVQTSDSGFIVAGYTTHFKDPSSNVYVVRTDSKGDTLWTRAYGTFSGISSEQGESVQQTNDGGFIIAGSTNSFGPVGTYVDKVYIIRIDCNGDTLWTKVYGGTKASWGRSVQQTSDRGFIIAGSADNNNSVSEVYLIRTDSIGDTLWTKRYGYGRIYCVDKTSDGGFVICGDDGGDVYIIKTDSKGQKLWDKTYGSQFSDRSHSIKQTSDGGFVVAGYGDLDTVTTTSGFKMLLLRLDNEGNLKEGNLHNIKDNNGLSLYCTHKENSITINYSIPAPSEIKLEVFDTQGKFVKVIIEKYVRKGAHSIRWNIRRDRDRFVADGVYLIRLSANDYSISKKVTIVK